MEIWQGTLIIQSLLWVMSWTFCDHVRQLTKSWDYFSNKKNSFALSAARAQVAISMRQGQGVLTAMKLQRPKEKLPPQQLLFLVDAEMGLFLVFSMIFLKKTSKSQLMGQTSAKRTAGFPEDRKTEEIEDKVTKELKYKTYFI